MRRSYPRTTVEGTEISPQPTDGLLCSVFLYPEDHLPISFVIQTHPSCRFHPGPSIFPAYAGTGLRRNPSTHRRISRNGFRGAATSASWNVTYRPWRTTLAPVLTGVSRSVERPVLRVCNPRSRQIFPLASCSRIRQPDRLADRPDRLGRLTAAGARGAASSVATTPPAHGQASASARSAQEARHGSRETAGRWASRKSEAEWRKCRPWTIKSAAGLRVPWPMGAPVSEAEDSLRGV